MSKIRNPRSKKEASLERDHRVFPLEGDKTFRKSWPKTKAAVNQRLRRAEHVALKRAETEPEAAELAVREARKARKRMPEKLGVMPLKQHLEVQAAKSLRWTGVTGTSNSKRKKKEMLRIRGSRLARS